jgi:hypothetical protein
MNLFQFGRAGAGSAQWKLQADYGRPSCRWSDGTSTVLLPAGDKGFRLAVGTWYRLTCERTSAGAFVIRVDDPATGRPVLPPKSATGSLDTIMPTGGVTIGGKRVDARQSDADTDQFHGDLDNITFGTGEPAAPGVQRSGGV